METYFDRLSYRAAQAGLLILFYLSLHFAYSRLEGSWPQWTAFLCLGALWANAMGTLRFYRKVALALAEAEDAAA